jgi:hypothetical protein
MAHPTVEDAIRVLTDPSFKAAAQPSDVDPVRINPTLFRNFLYERGATFDEAEELIIEALDRVGGWRDTEVLPPFEETSPAATTPEVVELFLVPARALSD